MPRKKFSFFRWSVLLLTFTVTVESCSKSSIQNTPETIKTLSAVNASPSISASVSDLISYKNSPHKIFVGYLVGDGADPQESFNPVNSPDSVDFLEFFAGNDPNRAHWRAAQAKGTRIVACHFLNDAYFDGSIKDPST
ncbi:MAG: hypothetical protein DI598_17405, partial [Pseudopedobacter saltans]